MRLIDADKLEYRHNPRTMMCVDFADLYDAPTIHAVPIEVLQEIRQEIDETRDLAINDDINYAEGLEMALIIIDKHIEQYKEETR